MAKYSRDKDLIMFFMPETHGYKCKADGCDGDIPDGAEYCPFCGDHIEEDYS